MSIPKPGDCFMLNHFMMPARIIHELFGLDFYIFVKK